jgi:hypothetical protein
MRKGMHGRYPGIEPGQALVVMNVSFPDDADWEPITELLAEPRATGSLLVETIRAIEASASRIDGSLRDRLLETLTSLAGRAPQPAIPVLIVDARPAARAAIDAISNAVVPAVQWLSARDTRSREAMILSLARRTNPDDLSALTVLATDPDSRTRAAVASALSYWLVSSVPSESISETLAALLADDTTLAARRAVAEWPDEPDERLRPLAEQLRSHPSAKVRAAALRIVGV